MAVLTMSGLVSFSTARQSFSKTAAPVSAARPFNTVVHKPFVNVAKPRTNVFQKAHSSLRRPFYQQTTLKNRNLNNKVNTAKVISVNTVKRKRMTSVVGEQGINVVKPTSYWAWRPKVKMINHVSNNTRSCISLTIPRQTETGKESSNPFMAGSLPKTINSNNVDEESQKIGSQAQVMILDAEEYLILEDPIKQGRMLILKKMHEWKVKDSEVCKITRADGSSSSHGDIQALLRRLDRQDLIQLYSLVQERFKNHPLECYDLDLWGDLRMIFDGTSIRINMLVEKKYPLKKEILEKMINLKIKAKEDSNMVNHKFRGGLLGIKELLQDNAAEGLNTASSNKSLRKSNSFKPVARTLQNEDVHLLQQYGGAVTAKQKILKKNDLKARSILMMTLPSEHLLTFNKHKDAKSLFEAIEARFGGNEATKKTQKTLLKQMYETFNASSSESLDSILTGSKKCQASTMDVNTAKCSIDATIYAYLATQPNGSQVVHEDLEQIYEDDLDEMDLKWQLALLSMKARNFYQRTGKKIIINGSDTAGYDKKKVECFNCHKLGHFARECRNPRSQENRNRSQIVSKE
ncbi:ribonuclease H-like domain-containing protein [Tanacetum coccineum]